MKSVFFTLSLLFVGQVLAGSPVRELLRENRLDEAASTCRQFEILGSHDTDNSLTCAWVYFRSNRDEAAEGILQKQRKAFSLPEYQLLLGYVKMKNKQYDESRKIFEQVQNENKDTAIGLTATELDAESYDSEGKLDAAAFIYNRVVSEDPTRARAHWGLGRFYLARGDTLRAKVHLEQTAKLWPKHLGSRFNLGVLALSQNNVSDAARWLAECYRLDKADPGVLEQLGLVFEQKGLMTEAIRYWQRAFEISKDATIAKEKLEGNLVALVDALVESRKYEEALAKIESSHKDLSHEPKLLLRRGLVYKNLGKFESAVSDLQLYLRSNDNDGGAHRELGVCYLNQKQTKQAKTEIDKAITIEPTNGMNYAWLAYVQEGQGQLKEAKESWKKALEYMKEPSDIEKANRRLATIEKKLNKKDK